MRNIIIALTFGLVSTPLLAVDNEDAEFAGSCAWGLAEYGAVVPTDCSMSWTDPKTKKIYCFSSEKSKQAFLQDPEQNERKAAEKSSALEKK